VSELLRLCVTSLFIAVAATSLVAAPRNRERKANPETQSRDVSFNLTRLAENPRKYSLVISDDDEHTISGAFSVDQLQILKAIMIEAEKFAFTEEAVGTKEPITTRFTDKQEPAFIIDVQKSGNQSQIFLTLTTEIGRLTLEAGRAIRNTRREEGFFFDLLTRLESTLPKTPAPPRK